MTKVNPIKQFNHYMGKRVTDIRYTITQEFTGHAKRQHVARFCGEWIGSAGDYAEAVAIAQEHSDNRRIDSAYYASLNQ
jgi:hypothetical protein